MFDVDNTHFDYEKLFAYFRIYRFFLVNYIPFSMCLLIYINKKYNFVSDMFDYMFMYLNETE